MINNFLQHVTAMATQIPAFMTKKWMNKNYLWIYMEIMKGEVYAKTVNIIQRESIVINARKSSIGRMESNGTRQMCADVRTFYLFLFFHDFDLQRLQTLAYTFYNSIFGNKKRLYCFSTLRPNFPMNIGSRISFFCG